MTEVTLSNGGMVVCLVNEPDCTALAMRLTTFLTPYFLPLTGSTAPDLTLTLHPAAAFPSDMRAGCTTPFELRKSSAPMFNLNVLLGTGDDATRLAWDEVRDVGYRIDAGTANVHFYSGENGFIHLIELVRYYGLLVEQARGSVVLHSAAVVRIGTNEVAAIVGPKGAGKTTTMLALIATGMYQYFSGDKVLLDLHEGQLRARGWPDYPHIGIGTLRQHQVLAQRLGVALTESDGTPLDDRHKVLIDPIRLMSNLDVSPVGAGTLATVILPRVDGTGSGELEEIDSVGKQSIDDAVLFEWPHTFVTARWHGMAPIGLDNRMTVPAPLREALQRTPWHTLFGRPQRQAA